LYGLTTCQIGFEVTAFSILTFSLGAPVPRTPSTSEGEIVIKDNTTVNANPKHKVVIDADAKAYVAKKSGYGNPVVTFEGAKPSVLNNGRLEMDGQSGLLFTPTTDRFGQPSDGAGGGLLQEDDAAVTQIETGATITCGKKTSVRIKNGTLELKDKANANINSPRADITITSPDANPAPATLEIFEGAKLERSSNSHGWVRLVVNGNFTCSGTVTLVVNHTMDLNDLIEVSGKVTYYSPTLLRIWWYQGVGQALDDHAWTLVTSGYGGVGDPINATPPIEQDVNNHNITLTAERNAAKNQLKVRSS
jgi:hypothetical protein